jgi:hypothetical protein
MTANDAAMNAGEPYTRCITIIWGKFGAHDHDNRKLTECWLRYARRWARARGFTLRYSGVQEWGEVNRAHVHLLLYIAPDHLLEFGRLRLARKWALECLKLKSATGLTDMDQLYPPKTIEADNGTYEAKLYRILHYFMKCAPADLETSLGMTGLGHAQWGQESLCYGKRVFISQGAGAV